MNIVVRKKIEEVKSKLDFRSQTQNPRSSSDMNDFGCRIFRTPIFPDESLITLQIYIVFNCVHFPLQCRCTVYIFYHIQSNVEITLKKTVNQFTIILLYLEQQLNVIRTTKLQWKVGHN